MIRFGPASRDEVLSALVMLGGVDVRTLDMIHHIKDRRWPLPRRRWQEYARELVTPFSSVHRRLMELEDDGIVTSRWADEQPEELEARGGLKRRVYSMAAGRSE